MDDYYDDSINSSDYELFLESKRHKGTEDKTNEFLKTERIFMKSLSDLKKVLDNLDENIFELGKSKNWWYNTNFIRQSLYTLKLDIDLNFNYSIELKFKRNELRAFSKRSKDPITNILNDTELTEKFKEVLNSYIPETTFINVDIID